MREGEEKGNGISNKYNYHCGQCIDGNIVVLDCESSSLYPTKAAAFWRHLLDMQSACRTVFQGYLNTP